MLVAVRSTLDNQRSPRYAEQAFAAIHQGNSKRLPIVLEYGRPSDAVGLYCRFPRSLRSTVVGQLAAAYAECKLEPTPDDALDMPAGYHVWTAELRLRPDVFPIRRHWEFQDILKRNVTDPLTGILAALGPGHRDLARARVELHITPTPSWQRRYGRRVVRHLASPFFLRHPLLSEMYAYATGSRWLWPLTACLPLVRRRPAHPLGSSPTRQRDDDLNAALQKVGRHLFRARMFVTVAAAPGCERYARSKVREVAGTFGQFTAPCRSTFKLSRIRRLHRARRRPSLRCGFLLSDEELGTLFHPATEMVRAETMDTNTWVELEPPATIASGKGAGEAILGRVKFRSHRETFAIRADDRRRHLAVVGKTGMGKSTLLENLVVSDVIAGRGVGLIDPHGDLAEAILDQVPGPRTNDVIVFDAGDRQFPVAFNPLECSDPEQRPLIASGVVSAFKKLYGDSWGPRLEYILRNALLALVANPGTSLLSLQRMLSESAYRKTIVSQVDDPVVRSFWQNEFAGWNDRFRTEAISPIQNKVGQFLSSPILRAIVGQAKNTIDFRRTMDAGQVLIINLSKGRIGEDASTLLGSLLVTSIQQAAMSRAEVPEEDRRDFHLYVDEFQNFATESFATILSEARKYGLNLTIANQYLAQMDEQTRDAVFGNVGSLVSFQVGPQDAEVLAEQLAGDVEPRDLIALPRFTAYVRLLVEGMPSRPFSMETLSPARPRRGTNRSQKVRNHSRHRYSFSAKR